MTSVLFGCRHSILGHICFSENHFGGSEIVGNYGCVVGNCYHTGKKMMTVDHVVGRRRRIDGFGRFENSDFGGDMAGLVMSPLEILR